MGGEAAGRVLREAAVRRLALLDTGGVLSSEHYKPPGERAFPWTAVLGARPAGWGVLLVQSRSSTGVMKARGSRTNCSVWLPDE